ncbi:MAG: 5-formyltetrahydrofolate cyclo-ligase [Synergistaceae bacterium]|nr:5-formyltetrahydrofolate cyclo-ligase [Synergistaceae bacterium]
MRKKFRERLKNLSDSYVKAASEKVQTQILASDAFKNAEKIFIYISTPKEPSTLEIIKNSLNDGKKVYVPKCKNQEMFAVRIYDFENLIPGKLGILEPESFSEILPCEDFDLIIVPCLSASVDGKRLGHGAGYYDKFLAKSRENQNIICLCFHEMLSSEIPMCENDFFIPSVFNEE